MASYTIPFIAGKTFIESANIYAESAQVVYLEGDTGTYVDATSSPDYQQSIGLYSFTADGQTWYLNYHMIRSSSATSTFLQDKDSFALRYVITFNNGDKANYVNNEAGDSILGKYQYNKFAWYMNYSQEVEFNILVPGSAQEFRENLNENFDAADILEEHVEYNVGALRDSLKTVAFSGLTSDLTDDAQHRFVTDVEKTAWSNRLWIETNPSTGKPTIYLGLSTNKIDVSSAVGEYIDRDIPSKTSLLTNDSSYVTRADINDTSLIYKTTIPVKRNQFTLLSSPYEGLYDYICDIDLTSWVQTEDPILDREPTIIFEHSDVVDPNKKLSNTCQWVVITDISGDSTAHLLFWSNDFWPDSAQSTDVVITIPVIVAVVPNVVIQ